MITTGANQAVLSSASCKRYRVERRQRLLRTAIYSVFMNRRRGERRAELQHVPQYVDVHEPWVLLVALGVVLLSVTDAYFTMALLSMGAIEVNPVMAYALEFGGLTFFASKMLLTAGGVALVVQHKKFRLLNRLSGYQVLSSMLLIYVCLVTYQLYLLRDASSVLL